MLVRDNEQLKAEVKELLNSSTLASTSRDQGRMFLLISQSGCKLEPQSVLTCKNMMLTYIVGDGVESQPLPESPNSSSLIIPEDFESQKEVVSLTKTFH